MLKSYIQNGTEGMTKEAYFEMCAALGTDPEESEIPVDFDDFPMEIQQAFLVYHHLRDSYSAMDGRLELKPSSEIIAILDLLEIDKESRVLIFSFVSKIDKIRVDHINSTKQRQQASE